MSIDMLPNNAGPVQRQMAAEYAARRARLFHSAPAPVRALPRPQPVSPFDPRRIEQEIEAAVANAVASHPEPLLPAWKAVLLDVSEKYGVPVSIITGNCRMREILPARYEFAYRMVYELGMSLLAAGRRLNRDHTTILNAIKRHVKAHPELQAAVDAKRAERASVKFSIDDEILRLYFRDARSVVSIAKELDVSRPYIHALVHAEVMRVREAREAA